MNRESARGLYILIVEDSIDCAESTALLLRMYGHAVAIACTGPAAVEHALAQPPDVVLLDIGLPGMSGYAVAKRLNEIHWDNRPLIVAISGFCQEVDHQRSTECGVDLHLDKPADPERLRSLLEQHRRRVTGAVSETAPIFH